MNKSPDIKKYQQEITNGGKQYEKDSFLALLDQDNNDPSFLDEIKQEFRVANHQDQIVGFGYFGNSDNLFHNESFGFQTANFKEISISEAFLKQGMMLLQTQQNNIQQTKSDTNSVQIDEQQEQEQVGFSMGFSFANGFGKSLTISPSKLKQAKLLLQTQTQNQNFLSSQLSQQQEIKIQSSPAPIKQKHIEVISSKRKPSKRKIVQQKTLQSHQKPFNRLLIINSNKKSSMNHELQKFIKYPQDKIKVKRKAFFQDKPQPNINLSQYQKPKVFTHQESLCDLQSCIFCKQNTRLVTFQDIIDVFCQKYGIEYQQKATEWYHQIVFKLYKYNKYYPEIFNKRLNAPNIVNQIQSKYLKQLKSCQQPFGLSLRNRKVQQGIAVNLVVMGIHHIIQKNFYLIELSDGWYSLYVPFKQQHSNKNNSYYLTKLIKNNLLYLGAKVQTYGWFQYPIHGILSYLDCPNKLPCIKIMYNSLIKLPQSSKLGISNELFYKQPSKCHPECGLVSLYKLYLVRIIVDYKQQKIWFRLANHKQSFLLYVHDGIGLIDEYKQKEWFNCQNLKMISRFQFSNTRITKMLKINSQKGSNNILRQLLWNTSQHQHILKPCDILVLIQTLNEDCLTGRYQNKPIFISIKQSKINIADLKTNEYKIITQVKYLNKVDKFYKFKATSLSKVIKNSSHEFYQQLLDKKNSQLNN